MKMASKKSFVSIGMPVYNGENYLRDAIDSILAQSYKYFELIISDNASTDNTEKICRGYARRDDRVKYHRNKRNVGGPRNYNKVFSLSSGVYFKWSAHDDVLKSNYLEKCVNMLDHDPSIVLCHSMVNRIDEHGTLTGNYDDKTLFKISSWKVQERFSDLIYSRNTCWAIHGVARNSYMKKTRLHGDYHFADRVFLVEMGLLGRIYEIPEHLVLRRDHPEAFTSTYYSKATLVQNYRKELTWWKGEQNRPFLMLPHWTLCNEFFKSVNRAPLKSKEKLLCYKEITKWFLNEGWRRMKWDLTNELLIRQIRLRYGINKQDIG
jgi:glycosyltransferase involved in cell wall biosynthesis